MTTVVIVPVRDQPDLVLRFLHSMRGQAVDELVVLDNGSGQETLDMLAKEMRANAVLDVLPLPGLGIYDLWNAGLEHAEMDFCTAGEELNLLVCNSDVVLPAGAAEIMAAALRSRRDLWAVYPDDRWPWAQGVHAKGKVRLGHGVARDGGLYGPCFMVAVDRLSFRPLITDPAYEWWYGDDHLAREIEESGGAHARVIGLPVLHEHEGTARHHPETLAMRNRDRTRWLKSQANRVKPGAAATRRMPPGTKVWLPGGKRRDEA